MIREDILQPKAEKSLGDNKETESSHSLLGDFEDQKIVEEKFSILEKVSEEKINNETLDFIEAFSNNLIAENKKIWDNENWEYADDFENRGDDEDSIMRPFVNYFIEILKKTKETEYQKRGEEVLMNLLKKWNDFEIDCFNKLDNELDNHQSVRQTKENLAREEYLVMHSEFGIDENIDDFPEDIKALISANCVFIKTKNKAIELLGDLGTRKSIDFLVEEIIENKKSVHNKELATAFFKIDPEYTRQKLVELMKNNDEIVKVNAIMILYRLQFGKLTEEENLAIDKKDDFVCDKFHEIIEQTRLNKEELENLFKDKKDISDEEVDKITQNLIDKAGQILVDFMNSEGADKNEMIKKLKNYKADLILTASVYKGIDKKGNVKFEDLEGVAFEKKMVDNLSEKEIKQMMEIYRKNYDFNPKFQEAILDNFENILKDLKDKTIVYLFKKDNEIIAFDRFDAISDNRKYFGSFNVNSVISGSSVGSALMKNSLDEESQENEIEADCIPETSISARYIGGNCGFVVKGINSNYKKTGVTLFNIERKEGNKKYHYFGYSDKEIIKEYNSENLDNQFSFDSDRFIMKFKPKSKELIDATEKLIEKNYVMSNYVFGENGKEVYCAFERE